MGRQSGEISSAATWRGTIGGGRGIAYCELWRPSKSESIPEAEHVLTKVAGRAIEKLPVSASSSKKLRNLPRPLMIARGTIGRRVLDCRLAPAGKRGVCEVLGSNP